MALLAAMDPIRTLLKEETILGPTSKGTMLVLMRAQAVMCPADGLVPCMALC